MPVTFSDEEMKQIRGAFHIAMLTLHICDKDPVTGLPRIPRNPNIATAFSEMGPVYRLLKSKEGK